MQEGKTNPKAGLLRWLGSFVAFDVVILSSLSGASILGTFDSAAHLAGALTSLLTPPLLLLLNTIIPQNIKHVLVFWRCKDVLPSYRAFSIYALDEARISVAKLETRVGPFPTNPREQQDMWFGIYQRYKTDSAVVDAHRLFLIFRDLTSLSLLLALIAPLLLRCIGMSFAGLSTFVVFMAQFLLSSVAARQAGIRFVRTVLSLESHDAAQS